MARRMFSVLFTIIAIMAFATCSFSQESATIKATATVLPTLAVTGNNDLRFETVMPGIEKSVDKSTVGQAGEFQIRGTNSAEVTLDFALPDSLSRAALYLPLSFSSTDASYDDGTSGGQQAPAGTINPHVQSNHRLGGSGLLMVWIGGTVHPNLFQNGGDYAAEITLTVTYTGN